MPNDRRSSPRVGLADNAVVLGFRHTGRPCLDRLLEILPDGFRSVEVDGSRVVVGPVGAFVLAAAGDDPVAAGDRVVSLTYRLRSILATRLTWVPFIDPIVVVDDNWDYDAAGPATSVPPDLLASTIMYGAGRLDPEVADQIVAAAEQLAGRQPR